MITSLAGQQDLKTTTTSALTALRAVYFGITVTVSTSGETGEGTTGSAVVMMISREEVGPTMVPGVMEDPETMILGFGSS
jgi:hypothetical protein